MRSMSLSRKMGLVVLQQLAHCKQSVIASNAIGLEAVVKYNFARSEFDTQIGGINANTTTRTNQVSISLGLQFYFAGLRAANR
jgi:adenosyl cobinamide kinase/adenosyl cobinamide phosphate guanylyltransferase